MGVIVPVVSVSQDEWVLVDGSPHMQEAVVADASIVSPSDCVCDSYSAEQCQGFVCTHIVEGEIQYGADTGICKETCCDEDSFEPVPIEPVLWQGGGCCPGYDCGNNCQYGGDYSELYQSWDEGFSFFANETEMAAITGEWKTDLLGNVSLYLTGDDIIRGKYQKDGYFGYIQGNYTTNETPVMEGLWWEAPLYRPPYQVGSILMEFNETGCTGVFSYLDGTWEPFYGEKVSADLSEKTEQELFIMPELNWTLSGKTIKGITVSNPAQTNPIYLDRKDTSG